jgi:hypothetical protein
MNSKGFVAAVLRFRPIFYGNFYGTRDKGQLHQVHDQHHIHFGDDSHSPFFRNERMCIRTLWGVCLVRWPCAQVHVPCVQVDFVHAMHPPCPDS